MKKVIIIIVLEILFSPVVFSQENLLSDYLKKLPKQELTQTEIDGIILMREEEKLAGDVYTELYNKWNSNIFKNITSSETTHQDWVGVIIQKYGLIDPKLTGIGVFTNLHMKELFDTLTKVGKESLQNGYLVGCLIEDLDIKDLEELIEKTDNIDIKIVYQNLMLGSRNHLRSFYKNLKTFNLDYDAQFIDSSEMNEIISSAGEKGPVDENGKLLNLIMGINDLEIGTSNAYPNIFSDFTILTFDLKNSSKLRISIYNETMVLIKEMQFDNISTNEFLTIWDGKNSNYESISSGIYFYQATTEKNQYFGKLIKE